MSKNPFIRWRTLSDLTQKEAGDELGITQAAISRLENGTYRPGAIKALFIENKTNGAVPKEWLRPDLWGRNA